MGLVHDGLGVVGLDVGAVAVLHDPRVGVGEVGLGLRFRPGLGRGGLAGVGDRLLVVGVGALLAASLLDLGVAAGLVGGFGLDLGAGGLQPGEALLAPVEFGGQVHVLAVDAEGGVLGFVGGLGVGEQGGGLRLQRGDLGLDLLFLVDEAAVAHRLVLGGVRFELGAVQGDAAHLDHAEPGREVQGLGEQVGQGVEVTAAEPGDRAEVRGLVGGQEPERDVVGALALDRPRGADAGGVAVDQQAHHESGVVGRVAPLLGVVGQDRGEVECLVDQVRDEPGEVALGQPVVQGRRQQQDLVRVEHPERLVHRRRTTLPPLRLDRLDLEQPFPITHTGIIPHERSRDAGGLPVTGTRS